MAKQFFDDQSFTQVDTLEPGEYDNCHFTNCPLAGTDLGGCTFVECTFIDCDLSSVKLAQTGLKTVYFKGCKLLAIHFEDAQDFLFAVHFERCNLELSTFRDWNLQKSSFLASQLSETDFTGADLQEVAFDQCDLSRTIFERTNLTRADFSTATNYRLSPEDNRIKGAKFSLDGLPGLLAEYRIVVE